MRRSYLIIFFCGALSIQSAFAQVEILHAVLPENLLGTTVLSSLGLDLDILNFVPIAAGLDEPLNYLGSLSTLGASVLGTPDILVGTLSDLGLPLAFEYIPALDALTADPLNLLDYFLTGGTVLNPAFDFLPAEVPLLASPLTK